MTKRCRKCCKKVSYADFGKNCARPDGLDEYCRPCRRATNDDYRKTDKGKAARKRYQQRYYFKNKVRINQGRRARGNSSLMKLRYGIGIEDYEFLFECQRGVCAICGQPEPRENTRLSVDHDHKTNKIRGLLCGLCNRGVGMFRDDPRILLAAVDYLRE